MLFRDVMCCVMSCTWKCWKHRIVLERIYVSAGLTEAFNRIHLELADCRMLRLCFCTCTLRPMANHKRLLQHHIWEHQKGTGTCLTKQRHFVSVRASRGFCIFRFLGGGEVEFFLLLL